MLAVIYIWHSAKYKYLFLRPVTKNKIAVKMKCKGDKFQTICPYEVESRDPEWMEYSGGDLKNPRFHLLFLEKSVH